MRLKEFIIFIVIFTIIYAGFFIILDVRRKKELDKKEKERTESLLQLEKFLLFARFYGLASTSITKELLHSILEDARFATVISLNVESKKYQITLYELIVAILYFEYYHLVGRKNISIQDDTVQKMNYTDQSLVLKYGIYFQAQKEYSQIVEVLGQDAVKDLTYINNHYIYPGVRIIDSRIYYYVDEGDNHEKQ